MLLVLESEVGIAAAAADAALAGPAAGGPGGVPKRLALLLRLREIRPFRRAAELAFAGLIGLGLQPLLHGLGHLLGRLRILGHLTLAARKVRTHHLGHLLVAQFAQFLL